MDTKEVIDIMSLPQVESTALEITQITWMWYIESSTGSLSEIFSMMQLTKDVPFAS